MEESMNIDFSDKALTSLIRTLEELKSDSDKRLRKFEINKSLGFLRIPKILLLRNVCTFLQEIDIIELSSTCKVFYKCIYSPIGYKLLWLNSNEVLEQKLNTLASNLKNFVPKVQEETVFSMGKGLHGEDTMAQMQTLLNVKEFLTSKLKESEESIKILNNGVEELKNQLKLERRTNEKALCQIKVLDSKSLGLETQVFELSKSSKDSISKLAEITTKFDSQTKEWKEEKDHLNSQRRMLAVEVKKLRDELERVSSERNDFRNALIQLKQAFTSSPLYS